MRRDYEKGKRRSILMYNSAKKRKSNQEVLYNQFKMDTKGEKE